MATKPKQPRNEKVQTMTEDNQVQADAAVEEAAVVEQPQEPTPSIDDDIWAKGELSVSISDELRRAVGQAAITYGDTARVNVEELAQVIDRLMPPKPLTLEQGVLAQRKLWAVLQNVLRSEGALFNINISLALALIHEYRDTVFADEYVFRFFENVPLNSVQLRAFRLVVVLLKEVADPATRKANVKNVRPEVALQGVFDDEVIARVRQYLQLG